MSVEEIEMYMLAGEASRMAMRFGKRLEKIARILSTPEAVLDPKSAISKIAKAVGKDVFKRIDKKSSRTKKALGEKKI